MTKANTLNSFFNLCVFISLVSILYYFDYPLSTPQLSSSPLLSSPNLPYSCYTSLEWIDLDNETYLRTNTSKYFHDEKKFVVIFTSKANTIYNNKVFELNFNIKYKNKIFNKHQDKYELVSFFNIRHYQDFILFVKLNLSEVINERIIDLAQLRIETVILLKIPRKNVSMISPSIKTNIGYFRDRNIGRPKEAVVCTEPLFLEDKDASSLSWWIEMTKLAGYKKIVIFNNSVVNTYTFENLFETHKHYVEIKQFRCLPNFIHPEKGQYLTNYKEFISGEWKFENVHFLGLDGIANNECLYENSYESNLVMIQDNDESFLVPRLENFDTLPKGRF
jgi:hypothetical protein